MLIRFNGKRQFRQIEAYYFHYRSSHSLLTFYKRRALYETRNELEDEIVPNIATGPRARDDVSSLAGFWLGMFNLERGSSLLLTLESLTRITRESSIGFIGN